MEKLPKAVRNAAADVRESIERNRAPLDWEVVNALRDEMSGALLHDVYTPLIEDFLRSLSLVWAY